MLKFGRYDGYLILTVAAVVFFLVVWQRFAVSGEGAEVVVQRNGETIGIYSLAKEERLVFTDGDGGKNILVIQDGKAYMEEADCPDKLCMKQKAIEKAGESIICLPHRLVVRIIGGEKGDVDVVFFRAGRRA